MAGLYLGLELGNVFQEHGFDSINGVELNQWRRGASQGNHVFWCTGLFNGPGQVLGFGLTRDDIGQGGGIMET